MSFRQTNLPVTGQQLRAWACFLMFHNEQHGRLPRILPGFHQSFSRDNTSQERHLVKLGNLSKVEGVYSKLGLSGCPSALSYLNKCHLVHVTGVKGSFLNNQTMQSCHIYLFKIWKKNCDAVLEGTDCLCESVFQVLYIFWLLDTGSWELSRFDIYLRLFCTFMKIKMNEKGHKSFLNNSSHQLTAGQAPLGGRILKSWNENWINECSCFDMSQRLLRKRSIHACMKSAYYWFIHHDSRSHWNWCSANVLLIGSVIHPQCPAFTRRCQTSLRFRHVVFHDTLNSNWFPFKLQLFICNNFNSVVIWSDI